RLRRFSMRSAQLAQVMPPMLSSTWRCASKASVVSAAAIITVLAVLLPTRRAGIARRAGADVERERRGAHHALVLEIEEQSAGARARHVHGEHHFLRGGVP